MLSYIHFIVILLITVILDLIFGDPNNRIHPVAWLGKYINYFIPKIKRDKNKKYEKINGVIFTGVSISAV